MNIDEIEQCIEDIMAISYSIDVHFRIAWRQAIEQALDVANFLVAMDDHLNDLDKLITEYSFFNLSNTDLLFQYEHFRSVLRSTIEIVCARNASWVREHEILFETIALKAIILREAFKREKETLVNHERDMYNNI